MNLNPFSGIDKSMNLGQVSLCLLCAVLGAGFVKVLDRFESDDTVTAKQIRVTNDDGKTIIQMDGSGLQVMAEDEDSYTRIKGMDKAQIDIVRDGKTVVALGQSALGSDGLALYHGGKLAAAMSVNDSRSVLGLLTPSSDSSGAGSIEDHMAESKGFALLSARAGSTELKLLFDSESKEMVVPGAEK
jgi:hypothetical protein